jgi:hypothetical protein
MDGKITSSTLEHKRMLKYFKMQAIGGLAVFLPQIISFWA